MSSEVRKLAARIGATEKKVDALSRPQLAWSAVEGGAIVVKDDEGIPRMTVGVQPDGTHTVKHIQGPPPPAPTAPIVDSDLSTIIVRWDGGFEGERPEDWARVEVHVGEKGFTPTQDTLRGSLVSQDGGELNVRVLGGTYDVRLVAVSHAHAQSDPTEPVTVTVEGITDHVRKELEESEGRLTEAQEKALEDLAELDRRLAGVGEKADQATQDAQDAHNRAVAAQDAANDAAEKYGMLDQRTLEALNNAAMARHVADEAYRRASSGISADEVEERILASANGKNRITVSTSAPGSSKGIAGDLWRRVDGNGYVFAEWTHNGTTWVPSMIRSDMITNLDVHKLTVSGSARVAEAVIDKLWVDGLVAKTITTSRLVASPGNVYRDPNLLDGDLWGSMYQPDGGRYGGPSIHVEAGSKQRGKYDLISFPAGYQATDRTRVRAGWSYRVGVWVNTTAQAPKGSVAVYVRQYASGEAEFLRPILTVSGEAIPANTWTWVEGDITLRDDAEFIAVGCFLNPPYDGEATFSDLTVIPKVGAVLIEDGAVTAPKITASEELTAKIAEFLKIQAGQIEADAIDGMTITGATIQTSKHPPRVVMNTQGLQAVNASNQPTLDIASATGDVSVTGDFATGQPGEIRTVIRKDLWQAVPYLDWLGETVYADGSGIRIGRDDLPGESADITYAEIPSPGAVEEADSEDTADEGGEVSEYRPALVVRGPGETIDDQATLTFWGTGSGTIRVKEGQSFTIRPQTNRGEYIRLQPSGSITARSKTNAHLYLRHTGFTRLAGAVDGKTGAQVRLQSGATIQSHKNNSVHLRTGTGKAYITVGYGDEQTNLYEASQHRFVDGDIYYLDPPTSTYNANMYLGTSGRITRGSSSSRRYKLNIEDYDVPEALLDVPFRTWVDKSEAEEKGTTDGLPRLPGLIAEEVADVDPTFVIFDEEGRPDALHGDRIGMAALTLIRRQRDRITELEEKIAALEEKING